MDEVRGVVERSGGELFVSTQAMEEEAEIGTELERP